MEERNSSWVIYPEYFDARLSRRLGRKISLEYSIEAPSIDEVLEAVRKAKLRIIRIERDKKHPANWLEARGRLVIFKEKNISKRQILFRVASHLKEVRKKGIKKVKMESMRKKKKRDLDKYLERVLKTKKR